jgi:hypothetical protein
MEAMWGGAVYIVGKREDGDVAGEAANHSWRIHTSLLSRRKIPSLPTCCLLQGFFVWKICMVLMEGMAWSSCCCCAWRI